MAKLASVVITFHPDQRFYKHIQSYLPGIDHLYVMDNSEPAFEFKELVTKNEKVTLIQNGQNEGIAARLNQAAVMARSQGYEWLLTMDQDSYFETEHLSSYVEYALEYPDGQEVAMFGVETVTPTEIISNIATPVDRLITSGSLLNLQLFEDIGGFDENLFIDEVDHEYCYRAILKGYQNIQFSYIFLHHQLGESVVVHSIKGKRKTAFHSPLRLYYMVRNYLYMRRKYHPAFEKDLNFRARDLMHRIKNNLLHGPDKAKLLKMLYQAYKDYRKGQMGKKRPY